MNSTKFYLCRDIRGDVHIVPETELVKRSSVYAVIKSDQGVLLASDRTSNRRWDLPGGGIESDEDTLTGLKREVAEETGLEVIGSPKHICTFIEYFYDVDSERGWESERSFFEAEVRGEPTLHGNADDIVDVRFFKEPYSDAEIAPVAKEILVIASKN